jgi:hypothetical protein
MKITRKSDKFALIGTPFPGTAYCPNCHGRLKEMKNNEFDLKCWECGEEVPIKTIRFQTQPAELDTRSTSIVQPKNWKRNTKDRPKNPIEQELTNMGLQVMESDWRDQKD